MSVWSEGVSSTLYRRWLVGSRGIFLDPPPALPSSAFNAPIGEDWAEAVDLGARVLGPTQLLPVLRCWLASWAYS
jgi:hypothetical protein